MVQLLSNKIHLFICNTCTGRILTGVGTKVNLYFLILIDYFPMRCYFNNQKKVNNLLALSFSSKNRKKLFLSNL